MKFAYTLFLYCLFTLQSAWGADIELQAGKHGIHAEIANTYESRMSGLMQREHLCADCGMLFIFPKTGRYKFWMKNTPLPLSIAFIAADGRIINIAEMQPHTTDMHDAQGDALYALEMNSGWYTRNGIRPDDKVQGLRHAPRGF